MAGQKPGSVGLLFDPETGLVETHCSVCSHCQRISEFPSLRKMHEHVDVCRTCMKLVCLECAGKPCLPWEKQVEYMEARDRLFRDLGL